MRKDVLLKQMLETYLQKLFDGGLRAYYRNGDVVTLFEPTDNKDYFIITVIQLKTGYDNVKVSRYSKTYIINSFLNDKTLNEESDGSLDLRTIAIHNNTDI